MTQQLAGTGPPAAETGLKALKILGLENQDKLSKHDLVLFLYAVGLVSRLRAVCVCRAACMANRGDPGDRGPRQQVHAVQRRALGVIKL